MALTVLQLADRLRDEEDAYKLLFRRVWSICRSMRAMRPDLETEDVVQDTVYVVYRYVLPGLFGIGSALMAWFRHLSPWLDFQSAQAELYDMPLTAAQWGHLAVSGFIWLVVPLVIGLWRIRRAEVK